MPDVAAVDRAVTLIKKGRTNRIYFFDKLNDPSWINPLRERGFFSQPPDPVEADGSVIFPLWPESEYLARMASIQPELVAQVLKEMPETENVAVRRDLLVAAASLNREAAIRISIKERAWIHNHSHLSGDYPEAAAQLAIHLAEIGANEESLDLLHELLAVIPTGKAGARAAYAVRLEQWTYGQVAAQAFPRLADLVGLPAIAVVGDLLQVALELDPRAEPLIDYSDIWRPAIEDHEQNVEVDFRDALIAVARDTALEWVEDDRERLRAVTGEFTDRGWIVFRRLALHILAQKIDVALEEVIAAALDPANFFEERVLHEYMEMAQRIFGLLTDTQQAAWFALIDQGPAWPARDPAERAREGRMTDEEYERYVKIWRRDRLQVIEMYLPPQRDDEFQRLIAEYGRNEHPTFHSYHRTWVGPSSPISKPELAAMTPRQAIEFVRTWQPTGDWASPTAEGLGRVLTTQVTADPAGFSTLAAEEGAIDGLDPTYAGAVIRGLEGAVRDDRGQEVDWNGALALVELAVLAPDVSRPPSTTGNIHDWDPDWRSSRRDSAGLMEQAMSRRLLPIELAGRVWHALDDLSWDPNPTPEHEERYGGSNMDPLTLSINTVRGEAMHAVIQYATWRKLADEELDLTSLPEVASNLEAHLDPAQDHSESTRAAFGARLAQLDWVDSQWLNDRLSLVFPDDFQPLRLATWETFLAWVRPSERMLELLGAEYWRAIDELPTSDERRRRAGKDPGLAVAEHLATYAWWETVGLEADGLLHRFATKASAEELTRFVDFIGRSLDNTDITPEARDRLMGIWEQVGAWIQERPESERLQILAPFGWWYGSGRLDPAWADEQVLHLLQIGAQVDPDFRVGERLAVRATEDLPTALAIVRAYLRRRVTGLALYSVRDSFRLTLSLALKSTDTALVEEAEVILNEIGARGMLEFRDLLHGGVTG
jgi:hypothetical protein